MQETTYENIESIFEFSTITGLGAFLLGMLHHSSHEGLAETLLHIENITNLLNADSLFDDLIESLAIILNKKINPRLYEYYLYNENQEQRALIEYELQAYLKDINSIIAEDFTNANSRYKLFIIGKFHVIYPFFETVEIIDLAKTENFKSEVELIGILSEILQKEQEKSQYQMTFIPQHEIQEPFSSEAIINDEEIKDNKSGYEDLIREENRAGEISQVPTVILDDEEEKTVLIDSDCASDQAKNPNDCDDGSNMSMVLDDLSTQANFSPIKQEVVFDCLFSAEESELNYFCEKSSKYEKSLFKQIQRIDFLNDNSMEGEYPYRIEKT